MKFRTLGKTGFDISEISLGTWQVGGKWGDDFSKANADKIITALGGGVYAANVCDSLVYGGFADWYMPNYREINLMKLKFCFS